MEEQKTNVVITRSPKSQGISFILTFLFGPLGLFYSTVLGGIIMLILGIIITVVTLGMGAILVWLVCIVWGAIAVSSYNGKLLGNRSVVQPMVATDEAARDCPAKVKEEEVVVVEEREEYAAVLSLKSDEELKTLIQDEKMYDPVFVAVAREELMGRVVGKRRQRTEEEFRREQEERRQQAELHRLEEERLRLQQEEEQRRQEEIRLQEEAKMEEQQQRIQRIKSLSLGKMQDGWMLALGLGIFFGGMCIYNLMDITTWIFYDQLKEKEWLDFHFTIEKGIAYFTLVWFIFYGIGMKKTMLNLQNRERAGVKLVFYSLLISWSVSVLLTLSYLCGFSFMKDFSPYSYICVDLVHLITWMLCAIGFICIGKESCIGLIGKSGATYLSVAAWIYAGSIFLFFLFDLWYYILSDLTYQIILYSNVAKRTIGTIVCIICLVLMWKGWKYLLSSWSDESKV